MEINQTIIYLYMECCFKRERRYRLKKVSQACSVHLLIRITLTLRAGCVFSLFLLKRFCAVTLREAEEEEELEGRCLCSPR